MIVFIQLTTVGANAGPFNLYADAGVILFAISVSAATLITGNNYTIPDGTTYIKVVSTGVCTNSTDIYISTTTTTTTVIPTTTTTTTTTVIPTTTTTTTTSSSSTTTTTTTSISLLCYNYELYTSAPTFTFDYNYIDCAGTFIASALSGEGNTTTICAQADTFAISAGDGGATVGVQCGSYSPTTTTTTTAAPTTTTTTTTTEITSTTTTTTTTGIPTNTLNTVFVGIPDTILDYNVSLSNHTGVPITYRLHISNETQGAGVFHLGPQIIVPDGTTNTAYTGTITAYPFANVNGDVINAELSNDDGVTWTAYMNFNPPYTLPYGL
jgi:hypothetical protein